MNDALKPFYFEENKSECGINLFLFESWELNDHSTRNTLKSNPGTLKPLNSREISKIK